MNIELHTSQSEFVAKIVPVSDGGFIIFDGPHSSEIVDSLDDIDTSSYTIEETLVIPF